LPWEEDSDYIRSGHRSPEEFRHDTFRTITLSSEEVIKAVVHSVSTNEIVAEAGYTSDDYIRVFVTSDIKHKDKITYNSREYEVLPPESVYFRGVLEHRTALCRRLIT
jgi:hypothetical protein